MFDTLLETLQHNGLTIQVWYDGTSTTRNDPDNLGRMICWHKKYRLGDENPRQSREEWLREELSSQYHERNTIRRTFKPQGQYDYDCWLEDLNLSQLVAEFERHNVVIPLFFLDHSSQTIRAGAPGSGWDSMD